ncbi:unnamed protein product, partial [Rotaria sordida]
SKTRVPLKTNNSTNHSTGIGKAIAPRLTEINGAIVKVGLLTIIDRSRFVRGNNKRNVVVNRSLDDCL